VSPAPVGVKDNSLSIPVGLAVSGSNLYVTAFGSSKVGVFDTTALVNDTFTPNASSHITVSGGGPSGLALRANRLYVTIDPIDDVESILKFGTEDNLMIGTDYSHTDISANLSALDEVRGWVDEGRINNSQAKKILETNSKEFYRL